MESRQPPRLSAYAARVGPEDAHPSAVEFFGAIGRLVYHWGLLEQTINTLQHIAIHVSYRLGQPEELQISLSGKIRIIKRIVARISDLSPFVPMVHESLEQVRSLSDTRNDIIHSAIEGIRKVDPPRLLLRRYKIVKGSTDSSLIELTIDDINAFVEKVDGDVATQLFLFTSLLATYQDHSEKSGEERWRDIAEALTVTLDSESQD